MELRPAVELFEQRKDVAARGSMGPHVKIQFETDRRDAQPGPDQGVGKLNGCKVVVTRAKIFSPRLVKANHHWGLRVHFANGFHAGRS